MNKAKDKLKSTIIEFIKKQGYTPSRADMLAIGITRDKVRTHYGNFTKLMDLIISENPELASADETNFVNVANKTGASMIKSHTNKLNKAYAIDIFNTTEIINCLKNELNGLSFPLHKSITTKKKTKHKKRAIVAHVSDTHFGANINKQEVGGINEYNWTIAARRMALFADQIAQYKSQYRDDTKLVICINGDIIAGVIHNQEWFVDLLTEQFGGTLSILSQFIGYLSHFFDEVEVACTTGNHSRAMHKSSKDRAATHKYDSYETMIFTAVQQVVEAKYKNVKVNIPVAPYAEFDILGHKFLQTHGDTVINVGNPGSSLNMRSINNQINKLNSSSVGGNKHFDGVIIGHVHTATIQQLENGSMLIINGCLSGTDPYANSIGIFTSEPTQQLFEVTEEHAVGDVRFIKVKSADNNKELDNIIKPYQRKLT